MSTGTITLNFDTPDVNLVGTGDFDVSDAFKEVFTNNPSIGKEVSDKISEIFKNIDAKEIGTSWANKIKKSLKMDEITPRVQRAVEERAKKLIEGLRMDTSGLAIVPPKGAKGAAPASKTAGLGGVGTLMDNADFKNLVQYFNTKPFKDFVSYFPSNVPFNNFIKGFSEDIATFGDKLKAAMSASADFLAAPMENQSKSGATNPEGEGSMFEETLGVNVLSFSDDALNKLANAFGDSSKQRKKKNQEKEDVGEAPKGGFLNSLIGTMFLGKTLPGFISKLAGPALLAGGLVWMAIDGIRGWMKAEDWGVSKVSGALGGMLGGMGSGAGNALKNAGKGAAIAAGIGTMIGGPVGLVIGAILGAAIGGILGYIGGENLAKGFDKIGAWFKSTVLPELTATWEGIKKWYYEGLKPAIDEVATKIGPILKDFGKFLKENVLPVLKTMWEGIKWIGALLGDVVIWLVKNGDWIIAGYLDTLKKIWDGFVIFGEFLGFFANWLYEKYLWVKEKFIAFGEAVGEGAAMIVDWIVEKFNFIKDKFIAFGEHIGKGLSIIVDWVQEKWTATVDSFKNGFKKFFDWVEGLGGAIQNAVLSILPERVRKWFKKEKIEDDATEQTANQNEPTKAQALVVSPSKVTFQPAKEDKLYSSGSTDMYAKPDDILGKTFASIDKQLSNLNTAFNNSVNILNEHTQIFRGLLEIDEKQLGMLPSLVPIPAAPEKNEKTIPNSNVRDPAYEYRSKIYRNLERGI